MRLLKRSRIASFTKQLRWHTNPSLSGLDRSVDGQRCSPGNDAPSCRLLPTSRLVTVPAIAVGVSLGIGKYRRVDFARNIGVDDGRVARPIEEVASQMTVASHFRAVLAPHLDSNHGSEPIPIAAQSPARRWCAHRSQGSGPLGVASFEGIVGIGDAKTACHSPAKLLLMCNKENPL